MDALLLLVVFLAPDLACGASVLATALHSWDELTADGGPIWRYLRLPVSDSAGLLGLVGFAAAQVGLALHGYACGDRWALWALLAVRLGDCVVSHWGPWLRGRRPNPGLVTTPLYAAECALIGLVLAGQLW